MGPFLSVKNVPPEEFLGCTILQPRAFVFRFPISDFRFHPHLRQTGASLYLPLLDIIITPTT